MDEARSTQGDGCRDRGWSLRITATFDGGVRGGNPGSYACAAVLYFDGYPTPLEKALYLGDSGTSNEAEYEGLILALETAQKAGATDLIIRSDSRLVVEQVLGNWRVKESRLKPLRDRAVQLASQIGSVRIDHIHREHNAEADALVTALLDQRTGIKRRV